MESVGEELRRGRTERQLSLEEIAQATRVPARTLRLIEEDRFDLLPADVFTRGFIRAYARAVGIDAAGPLERYALVRGPVPTSRAPLGGVPVHDGGRKVGFAVAVAILLILFTLALSVVLRPRHGDTPLELSAADSADVSRLERS